MPRPKKNSDLVDKMRCQCPLCDKELAVASLRKHHCQRKPRKTMSLEQLAERHVERAKKKLLEAQAHLNSVKSADSTETQVGSSRPDSSDE
jgi:hypothetical protein